MAQDWINSPFGPINIQSNQHGLVKIGWGKVTPEKTDEENLEVTRQWILDYFEGRTSPLPVFNENSLTDFQRNVLTYLRDKTKIGQTITYAELATAAGHPNAIRAVGSVMAMNPWPLLIPCHRVVRSDGVIGNYSGEGGTSTKTRLLIHEGNKFDNSGRLAH
ncbi:MAG: methylated-DNA--[protein]-cysteine S-methyltransferase [Candidatus Thermoplasmatota archaeon]|nr:methylated-DNA--[protein]-cysteine S-methyltransferase [Candidatus Thermoplasmatota archaeon]